MWTDVKQITLISQNMWNFCQVFCSFLIKLNTFLLYINTIIIQIIELYPPFDQDIFNQDFPSSMELIFLSVNVK